MPVSNCPARGHLPPITTFSSGEEITVSDEENDKAGIVVSSEESEDGEDSAEDEDEEAASNENVSESGVSSKESVKLATAVEKSLVIDTR